MLAPGELTAAWMAGPRDTSALVQAAIAAVLLWWGFTAAILWLVRARSQVAGRALRLASAAVAVIALIGTAWTAQHDTIAAAHAAFISALMLWGVFELLFLQGLVTGPVRTDCPPQLRGWARFRRAAGTVIHHEIALAIMVCVVALLVLGEPNPLAFWIVLALWLMRLSAKLNLFLGVREHAETLLKPEMAYLATYFRRRALNPLWPFSALALIGSGSVVFAAAFAATGPMATRYGLLGTLLALGLLEHGFMVLPMRSERLWSWSLTRDRNGSRD